MTTKSAGAEVERAALAHLTAAGLECLATNFSCRSGEIDLVMREKKCLVFIEVRYRRDSRYGGGSATVTREKQRRIARTAEYFRLQNPDLRALPCRFDVIAASGALQQPALEWIRDAFPAR